MYERTNANLDLLKEQQSRQYVFLSAYMQNINQINKRLDGLETTFESVNTLVSKIDNLGINLEN